MLPAPLPFLSRVPTSVPWTSGLFVCSCRSWCWSTLWVSFWKHLKGFVGRSVLLINQQHVFWQTPQTSKWIKEHSTNWVATVVGSCVFPRVVPIWPPCYALSVAIHRLDHFWYYFATLHHEKMPLFGVDIDIILKGHLVGEMSHSCIIISTTRWPCLETWAFFPTQSLVRGRNTTCLATKVSLWNVRHKKTPRLVDSSKGILHDSTTL